MEFLTVNIYKKRGIKNNRIQYNSQNTYVLGIQNVQNKKQLA